MSGRQQSSLRALVGIVMRFACAACVAATPLIGSAATFTWDADGVFGNGHQDGSGTWSTGVARWNNGVADVVWPNSGTNDDGAIFGVGNGAAGTVTVSGAVNVNSITFNAPGSGNYTINGTTLTLNGTTPTIFTASGVSPTISAQLAGGPLVKAGAGMLNLTGTNSYTGGTTIRAGTLQVGVSGAGAGTITLGDAGTGSSNVQLNINHAGVSNNVHVANFGTGTATIQYVPNSGGFTLPLGNVTLDRATTFTAPSLTSYMQLMNTSSALSGAGNLTIDGTNGQRLIFNATAAAYTGNITIKNNSVFEPRSFLSGSVGNNITVESGGVLQIVFTDTTINGLNGAGTVQGNSFAGGTRILTVGKAGGDGNFSGTIINNGTTLRLTKTGAGTQIVSGANTYSGATTISGGTLQIGDGGTTGSLSTSSAITNNANLTFNRSNNITQGTDFAAAISGSGSVTKAGAGTLTLTGTNTYGGGTLINAGELLLNSATAAGGGTITLASGAPVQLSFATNAIDANTNNITVAAGTGAATIKFNSNTSNHLTPTAGTWTINRPVTFDLSGGFNNYFDLRQTLSGNSIITISSTGNTRFSMGGANSGYTGNIVVQNTAIYEPRAGLSATTGNSITVESGGIFQVVFNDANIGGLNGTGTVRGNTFGGPARMLTIGKGNAGGDFGGVIENNGLVLHLTKTGTGTQTFSGANTYTGGTTINRGTLELDGSINASQQIVINATGSGLSAPSDARLWINTAGTRQLGTSGNVVVGQNSYGLFDHDAGTTVVANHLIVGQSAGSNGQVDVDGGTLTINGQLRVGGGSTGGQAVVNVNAGSTVNVLGNTTIVDSPTGPLFGTLNLSGGTFNEANDMIVGQTATGIVNHTAGTATIQGNLTVGQTGSAAGTYNLSGSGVLSFNDFAAGTQDNTGLTPSTVTIGPNGQFNFTGGTLENVTTINASAAPDQDPGPGVLAGTFWQEGGRFVIGVDGSLNTATAERAETTIIGSFTQTAGTLAIDIFGADGVYSDGEVGSFPTLIQTDSDLLVVTGDLLLDGVLAINTNGVQPPSFGWYDVAYANSISFGDNFSLSGLSLYQVVDNPNGGQILQVAAPEPAAILAWAMLGCALGMVTLWRRRLRVATQPIHTANRHE